MRLRAQLDGLMAKVFTRVPLMGRVWAKFAAIDAEDGIPWTPMRKSLRESRVCLITTGGLHQRTDKPFNMDDPEGDPTYRVIPSNSRAEELTITHKYYDHRDADRDFNILLPVDRVKDMVSAGNLGGVTPNHYSFMGHIDGPHVSALKRTVLPQLISRLKMEEPDFVFLTPA